MTLNYKQFQYFILDFNETTKTAGRYAREVRKYETPQDFMLELDKYGSIGYKFCSVMGENKDLILMEREDLEPGIQISYLAQTIRGLIEQRQPTKKIFGIGNGNLTAESTAYIQALNDLVTSLGIESEIENEQHQPYP